jgi:predicted lipoprotein with Yx(FWY)xxD motif
MRRSHKLLALAFASSLVLLAACGDDDDGGDSAADATTTTAADDTTTTGGATTTAPAEAATVAVASSGLGDILVDSEGLTLYIFDNDMTAGQSSCNDACADAWPPLMASGAPTYGEGLDASMFSVITRADGSMQLAVNGKPLYRFASDTAAGQTTGQGIGGVWHVVAPDGTAISS